MSDRDDAQGQIRGHYRKVAVRQVDDLHDPEHQRQAAREQRVQAAEHDTLNYCIDPGHVLAPGSWSTGGRRVALAARPKYAASICSVVSAPGGPASVIRPSSRQCTSAATARAWLTSCSTSRIVTPAAASSG